MDKLPQCWQDVEDALRAGISQLILFGPPGTGKTYAGKTIALNETDHAYRLVCNEDMTAADVTGHWMPNNTGTWSWHDGAVIKAWKTGGRVVADEIDRASGDVLSLLLAMFDSPESASWQSPDTGETIRPTDGFSVVMTTNVEEMEDLPTALVDRFPVRIRINEPHPSALSRLSAELRNAARLSADEYGDRRISMRTWLAFDQMRKVLGDERGAQLCFGRHYKNILDTLAVETA